MAVVLFVCTGNAARSQMAEGLLKNIRPEFKVLSAGTKPEGLAPHAVVCMSELDLDISNQMSNHINEVPWKKADYVITLCDSANETCVMMNWPESCLRLHWPIPDPKTIDEFRSARDKIKHLINKFVNK